MKQEFCLLWEELDAREKELLNILGNSYLQNYYSIEERLKEVRGNEYESLKEIEDLIKTAENLPNFTLIHGLKFLSHSIVEA